MLHATRELSRTLANASLGHVIRRAQRLEDEVSTSLTGVRSVDAKLEVFILRVQEAQRELLSQLEVQEEV